jgi:hypothetical protein
MKPAKDKKYNFLYKSVCIPTGEYYYGIHSTDNLDDRYIGSGIGLRESIRKFGKSKFQFEILKYCNSREEASDCESEVVTREMVNDPLCLNRQTGGSSNIRFSEETLLKLKKTKEQRDAISMWRKGKPTIITPEQRKTQSTKVSGERNGMFKAERPQEWRDEQSAKQKALFASGNHAFSKNRGIVKGRIWCHNNVTLESKMVVAGSIPPGFSAGRGSTGNNKGKPHVSRR